MILRSNNKIKCIIICLYIYLSICINRNTAFIHNFFPGILLRSNVSESNYYLTFPKLLFDYSSPFPEAHSYCEDASDQYPWKPKDDVYFEAGQKKEYSFDCKIIKTNEIKRMFDSNLLFNVSGFSGKTPACCLLHVDKTKIDYFYGYKITIPASPIGFSDLYFDVKFCTATALYSKEKIQNGSVFKQVLVLDVTPSFLASSVYIFLGMAVFSLVLSCLIISAIIHRWKSSISSNSDILIDNDDGIGYRNEDIEMKSISCDISYKTNEEKMQYYINKIDAFFNYHDLRSLSMDTYNYGSLNDLSIYNSSCSNSNNTNSNNTSSNNSNSNNNNNNNNINISNNINNNNDSFNYYSNNNDLYNRNRNDHQHQMSFSPTYHHNHYHEYILNSNINLNSSRSNNNNTYTNNYTYNNSLNNDYYNRSNNNQNYYYKNNYD